MTVVYFFKLLFRHKLWANGGISAVLGIEILKKIFLHDFFMAFVDKLGKFKPFETYFIFSPIWRSGDRQLRQFGDFCNVNRQFGDNH